MPGDSFERRYADAELIFFGVAGYLHNSGVGTPSREYREFQVEGVWKGPAQEQLRIYLHPPDAQWSSCDYTFEYGTSYLVFARTTTGYPSRYITGLCSGTTNASGALDYLRLLGDPKHRFPR